MRVLQVNDFRAGGGAEVVVDETVRLLEAAGHEVDRLTAEDVPGRRTPLSYVTNRRAVRALEARIASFRPHVVHYHNVYHELSPAVLAARAPAGRGVRRVLTAHDFHLACPNSGARRFTPEPQLVDAASLRDPAWVRRQRWDHRSGLHGRLRLAQHRRHYAGSRGDVRRILDVVLCPGAAAANFLGEAGVPGPIRVLPNPFDADAVRKAASSAPPAGPPPAAEGVLRLAFVGRLEPEKGLGDLLDAWPAGAPPAVLDVLGDGSERRRCASGRIRRLEIRCHGAVARATALASIAAADALLFPSLTPEVAPLVLLEALALGTPVIATDTGAMREVREATGTGFPLDASSPAALGRSLAAALGALGAAATDPARIADFLRTRSPAAYLAGLEAAYTPDPAPSATP